MLTLLRFDIKNTWLKIFVYCLVIAVFTAFAVYCWSPAFEGFFNDDNFYWIIIFKIASLGLCAFVCFICLILTFITLSQWFSQNLLAEEGHFMNMLPVSKIKLFTSKAAAALLWNIILVGFMAACVMVFMNFGDRITQINDIIADLSGSSENIHLGQLIAFFGIFLVAHSTFVCVLAYASICIGQMTDIGRNALILTGFIGIGLAELIIGAVIAYLIGVFDFGPLSSVLDIITYFKKFCIRMSFVSLTEAAIAFGLGAYLLCSRLNID